MISKEEIIRKTKEHVKEVLEGEGTGHDWWHVYRVWKNSIAIGKREGADMQIVQLGALLHDVKDFKFYEGDVSVGVKYTENFLQSLNVDNGIISQVCEIIENISFKGIGEEKPMTTLEGKVVRDADRLDAIGAIGIARCFAYGGSKGRILYNPEGVVKTHSTVDSYLKGADSSLHHFHEKLLLLKDLMLTKTGRAMAEERHEYMESYLEQFNREWEGLC